MRVHARTHPYAVNGYVRTTYAAAEVDLIAAYCAELDRVYVLPIVEFAEQSMVHLRARARSEQPDVAL